MATISNTLTNRRMINNTNQNTGLDFGNHDFRTKHISMILTQFNDPFSRFVKVAAKQEYTHISLGLEGYEEAFTFNFNGFALEKSYKLLNRKKTIRLVLEVSDEEYEIIENQVINFQKQRDLFKYTRFGVVMCVFGIPLVMKNRYFCSQFVAEVLKNAGIKLTRKSSLYLPQNLYEELLDNKHVIDKMIAH